MGWNYRVIYHPSKIHRIGSEDIQEEAYYAVHEVHYDEDDEPKSYSINPIINGDSIGVLYNILKMMKSGVGKPILITKNFEKKIESESQI